MINRVILVGRITRDPEIRYLQNGAATVSFSIAVERPYTGQNGERQADFINCVAWRTQAEFISRYIKKGYMMSVEGRIQTRQYQDQQGQTRYVTEVVCDAVSSLQPRDSSQAASYPQANTYQNNSYQSSNNFQANSYGNGSYQPSSYNNQGYQAPQERNRVVEPSSDQALDINIADDDLPF